MTEHIPENKPVVRQRAYQDPSETWSAKFVRKFNENPLVPIGCLLTCGALVMSAYKLRQGKSKEMNTWLRARVALQGVTIVALVAGSMHLKKAREAEQAQAEAAAAAEAQRQKQEFEKRLKEAERMSAEETELARTLAKGKNRAEVTERSSQGNYWWWWPRRNSSSEEPKKT